MRRYRDDDLVARARSRRSYAWAQFRRKLGLSNVEIVAKLLGLSTRSIQRYEQAAEPPAWYQAALLGLVETFPDRQIARRGKPKKPKLNRWGSDLTPEPANPYDASRWTKNGEPLERG